MSYLKTIPVCTGYDLGNGEVTTEFPMGDKLDRAKPVFTYLDGWNCDLSGCRTKEDLPEAALRYIAFIEKAVECPISYVSVGAEREAYVKMR